MFFIISCFCLVINVAVVKFFWPSNQKVKREQKMCCCVLSSNIKIKNKLLITYGIHIFGMEIFNVLLLNLFFRFFLLFLASLFFLFYIKFKRIFFLKMQPYLWCKIKHFKQIMLVYKIDMLFFL